MAIELITGRAGKAHIGSEDDRAYHAYTNGEGRYILNGGTANIESANNVHIDPVEFLVDGAHVRVTGAGEDVAIENGVASYKRIDVIALHYTRTGNEDNYVESVEFAVIKGANVELGSEPQVPDMPKSGTILTGADDVYVPVYSLLIDGLTPKNLTTLLEEYALPITRGGTGASTNGAAIHNLFPKNYETSEYPDNLHLVGFGQNFSTPGHLTVNQLREQMGLNRTGPVPVSAGGTGQNQELGAIMHMNGVAYGSARYITDALHIDTKDPYGYPNALGVIATEDASTIHGCPVKSGPFYGFRVVFPFKTYTNDYHFVSYLFEMYPNPRRVWSAAYNGHRKEWTYDYELVREQFHKEHVTINMRIATGDYAPINAPNVDGYEFIGWLGAASGGWVGAVYLQEYGNKDTNVWVAYSTASGGSRGQVYADALYRQVK